MRESAQRSIECVNDIRGIDKNKPIPLTQAMYDGGVRLIEVTYSANGAVSDEETA